MSYVDWQAPEPLMEEATEFVRKAREAGGLIKKGINETTKAIEREQAKLVLIASDVNPPEIVMHLPPLCKEKNIPYIFVKSKEALGAAAGIKRPASSVAIVDPGKLARELESLIRKINEARLGKR
ncbi:MAG: 50S ribosomal protein L7Ae [Crenarchaeota archaeon]|nr:50S ribosomal protein L7Ae [Thermoproteota archaeon]MCR8453466.1 50S ribosomal protein L7Ae [Thermoproteota archaeon]MCR8454889.1 50S ribosomal protein L7Ae [Thermoproteota archaeon]MCR8462775.1 50S ribosomal protein L7Ae [Thermoproteota archaeon]MCR8470530.1 50S ribosomal protein L7Ae [Thermoproteota archaeon]